MSESKMREALEYVREALQLANDSPNGGISDTIWMPHTPQTLFDFIDEALAQQPAAVKDAVGGEPVAYSVKQSSGYKSVVWVDDDEMITLAKATPYELIPLYERPQASAAVPDELTNKQVASACYSYRHDFGLMDKESQDRLASQCRQWWRAISKELISPSQHPFVLATAVGQPLPLAASQPEVKS